MHLQTTKPIIKFIGILIIFHYTISKNTLISSLSLNVVSVTFLQLGHFIIPLQYITMFLKQLKQYTKLHCKHIKRVYGIYNF